MTARLKWNRGNRGSMFARVMSAPWIGGGYKLRRKGQKRPPETVKTKLSRHVGQSAARAKRRGMKITMPGGRSYEP